MCVVVGVTGGIATGKSTVLAWFEKLGAQVLDADQVAREVLKPGSDVEGEVVREFGSKVLGSDGSLDRHRLGALVFADESALRRLNEITHPHIIGALEREISRFRAIHGTDVALLAVEIPLLVECDLFHLVDKVVVVSSEQAAQIRRLKMRSNLSDDEAAQRVAAQMPIGEKEKRADWIIRTDGTIEDTRSQVEKIWQEIAA